MCQRQCSGDCSKCTARGISFGMQDCKAVIDCMWLVYLYVMAGVAVSNKQLCMNRFCLAWKEKVLQKACWQEHSMLVI